MKMKLDKQYQNLPCLELKKWEAWGGFPCFSFCKWRKSSMLLHSLRERIHISGECFPCHKLMKNIRYNWSETARMEVIYCEPLICVISVGDLFVFFLPMVTSRQTNALVKPNLASHQNNQDMLNEKDSTQQGEVWRYLVLQQVGRQWIAS